jgi:hypothetical protein
MTCERCCGERERRRTVRKLVALAVVAAIVWRFVARRRKPQEPRVVVGFADGSTVALEPGSPEHERLVDAASEALIA